MWFDSQIDSFMTVSVHGLSVSMNFVTCFCIHYGTIVWDNTGTTPNTLYMKTVNKKNAHNYVCYLTHTHTHTHTHGRLGAQRKAEKIGIQGCKES